MRRSDRLDRLLSQTASLRLRLHISNGGFEIRIDAREGRVQGIAHGREEADDREGDI